MTQYYDDIKHHFGYNSYELESQRCPNNRIKAAYNLGKSLLLASVITEAHSKILDLGCGNGTEMLKFAYHNPQYVIFVDLSPECLSRVKQFAITKNIRYPFGTLETNFCTDKWSEQTVLIPQASVGIPQRVRCSGFDIITSFSTLECCPSLNALHGLCGEVSKALIPGGFWVGCVTNGDKLLQRCNSTGGYRDNYCQIQLCAFDNSYTFQTKNKVAVSQFLISLATLCRVAKLHGLFLVHKQSILDLIGGATIDPNYKRLRHASQLNGKYRLHLDDMRTLSLLEMFVFCKPLIKGSE